MAQGRGSALAVAAVLAVCALAAVSSVRAATTTFNVGGDNGWTLPSVIGGNFSYQAWANNYTYHAGDKLFFRYDNPRHTVLSVTGPSFQTCNFTSALFSSDVGNTTFALDNVGNYWFVCSVGQHCNNGMKFKVTVAAASAGFASASVFRALPVLLGALAMAAFFLF